MGISVKKMVHIVGNLAPGGMGSFLMNLYRNIDRSKVQFDFIVMGEKKVNYHDEAKLLGAHIYKVTGLSKNPLKYFLEIKRIIKNNKYDVVFRHTDVATIAIDLIAAKFAGAKRRIPHSHSTDSKHLLVHNLLRPLLVAASTDYFACSKPAAEWMYGNKVANQNRYQLVKNGIDLELYSYHESKREMVRQKLGFSQDTFVIGHVGNFVYAKNHTFMLDIFAEVLRKEPTAKLMLVGDGELREEIEKKIVELAIGESVILLGMRNDIPDLLQAMDVYLFPSVYEGLPVALVEAQAAGLPCLISDTIASEVKLTSHIWAYSNEMPATEWASKLIEQKNSARHNSAEELRELGYDIKTTVKFYEEL